MTFSTLSSAHDLHTGPTEWGPANHDPDDPRSHHALSRALEASFDLRDGGGQLPDDN